MLGATEKCLLDPFQLPLTLGFVSYLTLTLFKRDDVSSVTQKLLTTSLVFYLHFG